MPKRPLKPWSELRREMMQNPEYAALYREVVNEEIGAALKVAREAKGLSQREVAERMGVTRPRISQIEGAEGVGLSLEVLNRYAKALGYQLHIGLRDEEHEIPVYVLDAEKVEQPA